MIESDLVIGALMNILEGSNIFTMIKEDIDTFVDKYDVARWLSLSQVSTIHEILISGDKKRLVEYKNLQLKRASEKVKWKKEKNGKKAIEYFYDMVTGIFDRYSEGIKEELDDKFRLTIDNSYDHLISEGLNKIFDHIFVTEMRVLNDKEVAPCLKS